MTKTNQITIKVNGSLDLIFDGGNGGFGWECGTARYGISVSQSGHAGGVFDYAEALKLRKFLTKHIINMRKCDPLLKLIKD
jgi:hypothetical protein